MALERFPLGLNRDSQWARKCGVSADDSVSGMRFAAASDSSCDGCPQPCAICWHGPESTSLSRNNTETAASDPKLSKGRHFDGLVATLSGYPCSLAGTQEFWIGLWRA